MMTHNMNKIDNFFKRITKDLSDDISNNRTFCIVTYSALGFVALFMTVINIFTDKGFLTVATAIFTVLCAINIILVNCGTVAGRIAKVLFAFEVLCMFTYFLVSGNPSGFSAIWICMLPSIGMFFFNRFRGTIICICMFFIMVFFLWTPLGQSYLMYDYSDVFKMRFPVLFVAFHLLAYLLETLRVTAFREMRAMEQHYQTLSTWDLLTNVYNRQGLYSQLESDNRFHESERIGVLMFDIDHFKEVNDVHGHIIGDFVLSSFASILKTNLNGILCRWGGEEFVAVFCDDDIKSEHLDNVRKLVSNEVFFDGDNQFHITTSVGVATEYDFDIKNIDNLIGDADQALYVAKNSGRNQIVYYRDIPKTQD